MDFYANDSLGAWTVNNEEHRSKPNANKKKLHPEKSKDPQQKPVQKETNQNNAENPKTEKSETKSPDDKKLVPCKSGGLCTDCGCDSDKEY